MWPTLSLVVLFVVAMAALPWLLRRLQGKGGAGGMLGKLRGSQGLQPRVLGAVGVGPQQRVVTVEVGEGAQGVRLVLGVTAQNIQCLHVLPWESGTDAGLAMGGFSDAMAQAGARIQSQAASSFSEPGNV
jgi:flagellar protein FliO/FliZ